MLDKAIPIPGTNGENTTRPHLRINTRGYRSYLVILDAQNLTTPLAKCHLEHHLPQGFHGTWTSQNFLNVVS